MLVALIVGEWGVVGWGRNSYLGPAEFASFSSQGLSRCNKPGSFWLVVSTGYFYILFLWAIDGLDFLPLEIHKHLVLVSLLQPTSKHITISINILICFKYYTVWNQFFIKIHVKVFYIQVWFKCEIPPLFFSNKRHGLQKKTIYRFFSVDYVKINELHVVHTWRHMQSE